MKYFLILGLGVVMGTGCTIKNHALRGALNGVIGGPVVMDNINKHDGYVDDQDPNNIGGNFIHIWMSIGFCHNPVLCGAWLGSNAVLGAAMTHYHFKKKAEREKRYEKFKETGKWTGTDEPRAVRKIRFPWQSKYKKP